MKLKKSTELIQRVLQLRYGTTNPEIGQKYVSSANAVGQFINISKNIVRNICDDFFNGAPQINEREIMQQRLSKFSKSKYLKKNSTMTLKERAAQATLILRFPVSVYHIRQHYKKQGIKKKKVITTKKASPQNEASIRNLTELAHQEVKQAQSEGYEIFFVDETFFQGQDHIKTAWSRKRSNLKIPEVSRDRKKGFWGFGVKPLKHDLNSKFINYYNIYKMNSYQFTLNYLLDKRRSMLQFYLLKFLKYEHIVKLLLVSKDTGRLCDANRDQINANDSDQKEIQTVKKKTIQKNEKKPKKNLNNTLRYLMNIIALQQYSMMLSKKFTKIDWNADYYDIHEIVKDYQQFKIWREKMRTCNKNERRKVWQEFLASEDKKSIDEEREYEFKQKVNSWKNDLANIEEFGIKEKEFSELFKSEPVYTVAQLGELFQASQILTLRQYNEMVRELKTEKPEMRELVCLLRLHEQDLERGNLKNHQRWLWQQFKDNYNGFLIIVRSYYGEKFAFYVPHKFQEVNYFKQTCKQLLFYWINGDQLVTVKNSEGSWFESNDDQFIGIDGMRIKNNRNDKDCANLHTRSWSGILIGTDGYPTKDEDGFYYIARGFLNGGFKATAIEFYGVKTQT